MTCSSLEENENKRARTNCSQDLEQLQFPSSAMPSNFKHKRDHNGHIIGQRIQLDKYSVSKSATIILPQVAAGANFSFSKNCNPNSVTCVVSIDQQVITAKQGQTEAEARENAAEDALRLILIRKLYSNSESIPWTNYGNFAKFKMLRDWGLVGIPEQEMKTRKIFPRKSSFDNM